ncbi:hypothetical protein SAMN05660337_1837 [Maridesulfovibrio ferrireducens]|uniref:Uncharacterized protein n=1 Tax=Maridesulfovibrio ferrireducens TaxID=246191 RepID=A0A1G9G506_9BACT|nr:hypothetical protein [Maridesulfovibrio ferrireducens]SDK95750.1 hypothetical protein SAMN05660337_1837 [Maridesulfovibrio ferrireducens]
MLKESAIIKLITVMFLLMITGCASHNTKPAVPMTVFNPSSGSFNVKVVLFQLQGDGSPQNLESGIVPIEQNIITALEGLGYHYSPNGDVNYLIEARIGSISPKLAVERRSERVGFAVDNYGGWPFFNSYPVLISEWSPEIQKIKSGPDTCFITMQVLIKEDKAQRDFVVYHGTPRPLEVPFALGCPFSECGKGANKGLTDYILSIFTPATRN